MKRIIIQRLMEDSITVEMKALFAEPPSATLSICRHGVREDMFSLHELGEICKAIQEMKSKIEHEHRLKPQ